MKSRSMLVKVPATVGNFAGALGCAALALDAVMKVKVTPRADGNVRIRYFGENQERVSRDSSNLIVRAMETALRLRGLEFGGADSEIYSSIPVGMGLGSSTAAVLAGLIAADRLYSLGLHEKTLFDLARVYETRSENLLAAWQGGFVAAVEEKSTTLLRRTCAPGDFVLGVVAPDVGSSPSARLENRIPSAPLIDRALNLQRPPTLANLFMRPGQGSLPQLHAAPASLSGMVVPGLAEALKAQTADMPGAFICGSGPAVGILTCQNSSQARVAVRKCFLDFGISSTFRTFRPSNSGAREWNAASPEIIVPPATQSELRASRSPV
ncbi:MAG TPA: hypothetical protein VMW54_02195 [Terriglobia bacterium]|nr:hypothetical protein [Terriglobia bacterium]